MPFVKKYMSHNSQARFFVYLVTGTVKIAQNIDIDILNFQKSFKDNKIFIK